MRPGKLARIVRVNLRSNAVHFLLASVGVVVGIAAFAFFLALGAGVRSVVLGKILPLDQARGGGQAAQPRPRTAEPGDGQRCARRHQRGQAAADRSGVPGVYPKMKLTVPAIAAGGKASDRQRPAHRADRRSIDPALVADEVGPAFHDPPAAPAGPPKTCKDDKECGTGYCGRPREGGPRSSKDFHLDIRSKRFTIVPIW